MLDYAKSHSGLTAWVLGAWGERGKVGLGRGRGRTALGQGMELAAAFAAKEIHCRTGDLCRSKGFFFLSWYTGC